MGNWNYATVKMLACSEQGAAFASHQSHLAEHINEAVVIKSRLFLVVVVQALLELEAG